jgi:hypothetical protein
MPIRTIHYMPESLDDRYLGLAIIDIGTLPNGRPATATVIGD